MIYPISPRPDSSFWRSPFVLLLISVILIWLFSRPVVYGLGERLALTLTRPFWSFGASGLESIGRWKQFFADRTKLIDENSRLQTNLEKLMAVESERTRLSYDNSALREIFNYHAQATTVVTAAKILTRTNQSPFDVLIADVGSKTTKISPQVGDLVVGGSRVALGQVIAVYDQTVKIELFSNSGSKLDVSIGQDHLPAQAVGRGSGNFSASLPRDLSVKIGDLIMTIRGQEEYLVGEVRVIERNPSDAFQEILFRSPLNLELLSWVEIYGS